MSGRETCPRCGKVMVEKSPSQIYLSNPPQYDLILWCACGYSENRGRVFAKTGEEILQEKWRIANNI